MPFEDPSFFSTSNGPGLCSGFLGLLSFDPVSKESLRGNKAELTLTEVTVLRLYRNTRRNLVCTT